MSDYVEETPVREAEPEGPPEEQEGERSWEWLSAHAPWWGVSLALHVLAIILLGLMTWEVKDYTVKSKPIQEVTWNQIKVEPLPPPTSCGFPEGDRNVSPTGGPDDPPLGIEVPPDIIAKAELGTKFVTINLDREDKDSAFGNKEATMFHSPSGDPSPPGGGGMQGNSLEGLIGLGCPGSPGKGNGWGGGEGTGIGNQIGAGTGSHGDPFGGGRRLRIPRHSGQRKRNIVTLDGLRWLAAHQESDGHWDSRKYGAEHKSDTACTALALLAFLGAGHTERIGTYKERVRLAVQWLKSQQDAGGLIYDKSDAGGHRAVGYPHAIAGLALAEAAGMAKIPETWEAAKKALEYSIQTHGNGAKGWRYGPKQDGDLSVTGWYVMQIKSAKIAGFYVDEKAFLDAMKFVDACEQKDKGGPKAHAYAYQPGGKMVREPRTTAIGNLCRLFLGADPKEQQASVEYFMTKGGLADEWTPRRADLYYWYYASLCAYQQGGESWKKWEPVMMQTLITNQRKDGDESGSWDPIGAYADEWGRVGQTALAALCLEVAERYLPIHRTEQKSPPAAAKTP